MFAFEIGLVAFFGVLLGFQLKPNFSWLSDQLNLKIYKLVLLFGFLCSVYCILAGLNLFATDYMNEFTKPAIDKISTDPESLKGVHSPKRAIAFIMILIAHWTLLFVGFLGCFVYYITWKKYFT